MIGSSIAVLLMASAAQTGALDHRVQLDHASGTADVSYRGNVAVDYRQVGASGAPGRPSTLRCVWKANLLVDRQAQHSSGAMITRSMQGDTRVGGSRQGWCDSHRRAISQEIAARQSELRDHLIALAQEDHSALRAELDRVPGTARTG